MNPINCFFLPNSILRTRFCARIYHRWTSQPRDWRILTWRPETWSQIPMVLCFREIELAKKMKSCLSVASFFFFLRLVKPWNVSLRYFFSSHVQLLRAFGCDEKYPKLFLFHFKKWTAQKIYKSKYIPAQTIFRQQKDKLNYICISTMVPP